MPWAIIKTGGKQYRVKPGQVLRVEKLPGEAGASVAFREVLLWGDGDKVEIGKPLVSGMSVEGKIKAQVKGEKLIIFKFKAKVRYRVKTGHRQKYTEVEITGIKASKASEASLASRESAVSKKKSTIPPVRAARKTSAKRSLSTRKPAK